MNSKGQKIYRDGEFRGWVRYSRILGSWVGDDGSGWREFENKQNAIDWVKGYEDWND